MADPRFFADQLDGEDITYLAERYDFTEDFVEQLDDKGWCELLGCGVDELPFYLFDEATFDEYLAEEAENYEASLADDFGSFDDYDPDNPEQGLFDLSDYLERQARQEMRSPNITSFPRPYQTSPAPVAKTVTKYLPGERVRHTKFGDGTVVTAKYKGKDQRLVIRFDRDKHRTHSLIPLSPNLSKLPSKKVTVARKASNPYSSPSAFSRKVSAERVTHHYELVN